MNTETTTHNVVGVEVHYMDKGFSRFEGINEDVEYMHSSNATGHQIVDGDDVTRTMVAEWLDTGHSTDIEVLNFVWSHLNLGGQRDLGVRSMMVGDRVVLQTNNRGPKRVWEVADAGFDRVR